MNVGTIFENVAGTDQLSSLGSMTVAEAKGELVERFAASAAQPGPGQQQLFAHSASQATGFDRDPVEGDDAGSYVEPGRGSGDDVDGRGSAEGYYRDGGSSRDGSGSGDDSARGESF